ncbi:serine/threonine protein kinase [Myxosarcina sp. GI1(2024)]
MFIKFTKLTKILAIASLASLFSLEVRAQTETETTAIEKPISLEQAFRAAYFAHAKNAFYESGILGQLNTIFGFNRFPETQILLDGKAVDNLYRDALQQQVGVGMPLRTPDLPSPYETSLIDLIEFVEME